MNTSQINCFLAAAECLCFTKAAERMYLSQSGLSRQIAAMEREMGVELFKRGAQFRPTDGIRENLRRLSVKDPF